MRGLRRAAATAVVAALLVVLGVAGRGAAPAAAQEGEEAPGPPSAEALQGFFDTFFTRAVIEDPVPGAAVVATAGGEFVARDYGITEVGTTTEVRARGTIFAAREVSQVVTAVAALQLVDDGLLGLTSDVSRWLDDVAVPATFEEPITLADLLTHTSGLDGTVAATLEESQDAVLPLAEHLAVTPLQRSLPPGEVVRPVDEEATLTGLLVAEASGAPFTAYVRENVLRPLSMGRSGFIRPTDGEVAVGYTVTAGGLEAAPYGFYHTAPAQSFVSNATDMTALLRMLLDGGVNLDGEPILSPGSTELMLSRQRSNHPGLPGVSFGLFEHEENGERAWIRAGTGLGFSSLFLVMPERDLGLYAVYNSDAGHVREELLTAFLDEFFPAEVDLRPDVGVSGELLEGYAGGYAPEPDRRTFLGLRAPLFEQRTVVALEDGTIGFDGERWRPVVAPLVGAPEGGAGAGAVVESPVFQSLEDPDRRIAFGHDDEDGVAFLYAEHAVVDEQHLTLFRQPWTRTTQGFLVIGVTFAAAFLLVLLVSLVQRRRKGGAHPGLRGLVQVIAVANLGFLVLLPIGLALVGGDVRVDYGVPVGFLMLLAVPPLTLALSVVLAVSAFTAFARGRLSGGGMVGPLLVVALGFGFALLASAWDVLGPFGLRPYL